MMRPASIHEAGAVRGAELRAQADAAGVPIHEAARRQVLANLKANPRRERESLPGRTWREIAIEARVVVVMLAAVEKGDAVELARKPWDSFSDADKASMAACARLLAGELSQARSLY